MKRHLILLTFGLIGCSTAVQSAFEFESQRPIAAAHRAEHSRNSENTIDAIRSAQDNRIQFIEIDIQESLDGALFLFHNNKLDPETIEGPKELVGRKFKSLSSLEISKIVLPEGERVPRFEDAVDALDLNSSFILDVKGETETRRKVFEAISSRGPAKNYWMLCYDPQCAVETRRSGIRGMEVLARINKELTLTQAAEINPKLIQINCEENCSKEVLEIKSLLKRALILATSLKPELDQESNWQRMRRDGVDIILTDKPLELKRLLKN